MCGIPRYDIEVIGDFHELFLISCEKGRVIDSEGNVLLLSQSSTCKNDMYFEYIG